MRPAHRSLSGGGLVHVLGRGPEQEQARGLVLQVHDAGVPGGGTHLAVEVVHVVPVAVDVEEGELAIVEEPHLIRLPVLLEEGDGLVDIEALALQHVVRGHDLLALAAQGVHLGTDQGRVLLHRDVKARADGVVHLHVGLREQLPDGQQEHEQQRPVIDPLAPVLPVADEADAALAAADAPALPKAHGGGELVLLPAGHVIEGEHLAAQVRGQGALAEVLGIQAQPLHDGQQAFAHPGLHGHVVDVYLHGNLPESRCFIPKSMTGSARSASSGS